MYSSLDCRAAKPFRAVARSSAQPETLGWFRRRVNKTGSALRRARVGLKAAGNAMGTNDSLVCHVSYFRTG